MLKDILKNNLLKRLKTGLLTVSLADFISQKIEMNYNKEKKFDKKRFIIQSCWALVVTPYFIVQYHYLETFCKVVGLKSLLMNMFYLQFISSPICYFLFFMYTNLLHGRGFRKSLENFNERIFDILIDNGKFWPFVNLINFYFLQYALRIYFAQFMSLVWNVYLSYFLHAKKL